MRFGQPFVAAIIAMAVAASVARAGDEGGTIHLGMTRAQVIAVLGRPDQMLLERSRVRCLAYRTREHDPRFPKPLAPRDGFVVALRGGRVIGTASPLYSEITQGCADLAARYDRPPTGHRTCYRKFWLSCS